MMVQTWDNITPEKYMKGMGKSGNCRGNDNWFLPNTRNDLFTNLRRAWERNGKGRKRKLP